METLAIVLAIIFVGQVIDLKTTRDETVTLAIAAAAFLGAIAIGIFVAVTA